MNIAATVTGSDYSHTGEASASASAISLTLHGVTITAELKNGESWSLTATSQADADRGVSVFSSEGTSNTFSPPAFVLGPGATIELG
jgi:hypothetical protein